MLRLPLLRASARASSRPIHTSSSVFLPPKPTVELQDLLFGDGPASSPAPEAQGGAPPPPNKTNFADELSDILGVVPSPSPTTSSAESSSSSGPTTAAVPMHISPAQMRPSMRLSGGHKDRTHYLHVHSTRNNTHVTLTDPSHGVLATFSGGSVGFKKAQRSGYEAGYQAAIAIFSKIREAEAGSRIARARDGPMEVVFRGFGQGRQAVWAALMAGEGREVRERMRVISDHTRLVRGGTRPKKLRML